MTGVYYIVLSSLGLFEIVRNKKIFKERASYQMIFINSSRNLTCLLSLEKADSRALGKVPATLAMVWTYHFLLIGGHEV